MGKIAINNEIFGSEYASDIKYDNTNSKAESENIQDVIDEIFENGVGGGTIVNGVTIKQIKYTGDDTDNRVIEVGPDAIIFMTEGMGKGGNYMRLNPCILEKDRKVQCQGQYGGGSGLYCYSKYDGENVILSGGADAGARANASGESYIMTVFYKEDENFLNNVRNNSTTPIGTVISYFGKTAPKDYLICDGSEYNISEYKELADFIKNEFGSYNYFGGDNETTFAVPDLRGEFLRGSGTNSRKNQGSGLEVGEHQDATEIVDIQIGGTYGLWVSDTWYGSNQINYYPKNRDSAYLPDEATTNSRGRLFSMDSGWSVNGHDNLVMTPRPTNTSVLYCIKYTENSISSTQHIYDDTEKIVGKWFGKNLYERTFTGLNCPTMAGEWSSIDDIDITNIKRVINGQCYFRANNVDCFITPHQISIFNNHLQMQFLENRTITEITIQYTKTTD